MAPTEGKFDGEFTRKRTTAGTFSDSSVRNWASSTGVPAPRPGSVSVVGDEMSAEAALRAVGSGQSLLYRGHYANARQLLSAMSRHLEKQVPTDAPGSTLAVVFQQAREAKRIEHDLLSRLLVLLTGCDYRPLLDRAPALGEFGSQVWGPMGGRPLLVPLREWVGAVGAREWHQKGVEVPALGAKIHPHYGVFAPVRGEYVGMVAEQADRGALAGRVVFDIGSGTGVLAFVLARRGAAQVVATDAEERAVACARDNAGRLGLDGVVEVRKVDCDDPFPPGSADIVVCNPPWLPAKAVTPLERAVYDPGGRFLRRFLGGVPDHLTRGGQAWLVLSDLAERIGVRKPGFVADVASRAGLAVLGRQSAPARHPRTRVPGDPLYSARSQEVVTLYVLGRPDVPRHGNGIDFD